MARHHESCSATCDSSSLQIPFQDMSCQDLMTQSNIIQHGFLRRRLKVHKLAEGVTKFIKWPNCYVILHGGCIYIYENESSDKPILSTSLYGYSRIEQCPRKGKSSKIHWEFKVISQLSFKDKEFHFSAPTKPDMETWIERIKQQMTLVNVQGSPPPDDHRCCSVVHHCNCQPQSAHHAAAATGSSSGSSCSSSSGRHQSVSSLLTSSSSKAAAAASDDRRRAPQPRPPSTPAARPASESSSNQSSDDDSSDYSEIEDETDELKDKQRMLSECMSLAARNHKANSWSSSSSSSSSAAAAESVRRVGRQPPLVKSPTSDRTTPKPTSSDDGYYLVKDVVRGWQSASSDTDKNVECKVTYASTDEYLSFQPAQPKPKTKTDTSIVDKAYWTGDVHEAESKMKLVKTEGAYLIRESTEHGQQTLMVKRGNNVCKYRIYTVQRENMDKFCLKAGGPFFDSKVLLIKFYMSNMLPHDTTKLKCPYTACI